MCSKRQIRQNELCDLFSSHTLAVTMQVINASLKGWLANNPQDAPDQQKIGDQIPHWRPC